MAVRSASFFTLVRRYLVSFSFFTTWHNFLLIKVSNYLTATFSLTPFIKIFAGLNAGILWAGIITAVFLEILRPVFLARV